MLHPHRVNIELDVMRKPLTTQQARLLKLFLIAIMQFSLYFFVRMLAYTPQTILYQGF